MRKEKAEIPDLSEPVDDVVLKRRTGESDVLHLEYPKRLARHRLYREMNKARGYIHSNYLDWDAARKAAEADDYDGPPAPEAPTPSNEPDEYGATVIGYALIGLCWRDRKLPGVPRRPGGDLVEYGELVADGLYDLGYEVPSVELGDLVARLYTTMQRADFHDESEEVEEREASTLDFPAKMEANK